MAGGQSGSHSQCLGLDTIRFVPTPEEVTDRILTGTLSVLATYGSRRLSMTEVGRKIGLSRATLYRYFPTKDDLLDALTAHVLNGFERAMTEAVANDREPTHRLEVVVTAMSNYFKATPVMSQLLRSEASVVLDFYEQCFKQMLRIVFDALSPAFGTDRDDARWRWTVAEVVLRNSMSHRLVGPERGRLTPRAFAEVLSEASRNHLAQAKEGA